MKKFLTLSLILLPFLLATFTPAKAIEAPYSGSITSFTDFSGDCGQTESIPGQSGVIIELAITATGVDIETTPPAQEDIFYIVLRDGNNAIISSSIATVAIGAQQTSQGIAAINTSPSLTAGPSMFRPGSVVPTARPWTAYIQDQITINNGRGQEIPLFTFDPVTYSSACAGMPFTTSGGTLSLPLNVGITNDLAMYNASDDNGEPALQVYAINDDGVGTLALTITQEIIAPYAGNPPAQNTALLTSENGKVTLYILDTGELQINSGPDSEGKIHVLIFDGIPPTNIYGYVIDPQMFQ